MWCIGKIDEEYRERMYALLALYAKPYDSLHPIVCFDEKSKQLLRDSRKILYGKIKKEDYEYKRNGTRNIFVAVEPLAGTRCARVTKRRTKIDFAHYIKALIDTKYNGAEKVHLVLDNLNTHFPKSFFATFPKEEAQRILSRIEFHYTPKHASWLNMAEIEIGVMDSQCLNRRIPTEQQMITELHAWQKHRNDNKAKILWKFSKQDADKKLEKYYM
jgi:hypothetical protein